MYKETQVNTMTRKGPAALLYATERCCVCGNHLAIVTPLGVVLYPRLPMRPSHVIIITLFYTCNFNSNLSLLLILSMG